MLSALRYPHFRRFWFGNLGAVSGQQIMWVAQGWLVYDLTGSPIYLGYVGLATALPAIILNLVGGVIADRMDQRKVIVFTQAIMTAAVFFLAMMTMLEVVEVWQVLVVAFVSGCTQAFNNPARAAIFPNLVDRKDLMNAIALNSMVWQATRIVAPATGGALIAVFGVATGLYVCSFGSLILALAVIGLPEPQKRVRTGGENVFSELKVGISYIRANFLFAFLIGMSFFNSFFGFSINQMMPVFAKDILDVGPTGLGFLRTAPAIGSFLAALAIARYPVRRHAGRTLFVVVAGFGVCMIVFGLSREMWLSMLALALGGAFDLVSVVLRSTILPLVTPDELRGRVTAVEMVFISASNELGAFESGVAAALIGAVPAVVIGGVATIVVAGLWWRLFPDLTRVDRLDDLQPVAVPP
jgi:MFS family permease